VKASRAFHGVPSLRVGFFFFCVLCAGPSPRPNVLGCAHPEESATITLPSYPPPFASPPTYNMCRCPRTFLSTLAQPCRPRGPPSPDPEVWESRDIWSIFFLSPRPCMIQFQKRELAVPFGPPAPPGAAGLPTYCGSARYLVPWPVLETGSVSSARRPRTTRFWRRRPSCLEHPKVYSPKTPPLLGYCGRHPGMVKLPRWLGPDRQRDHVFFTLLAPVGSLQCLSRP